MVPLPNRISHQQLPEWLTKKSGKWTKEELLSIIENYEQVLWNILKERFIHGMYLMKSLKKMSHLENQCGISEQNNFDKRLT